MLGCRIRSLIVLSSLLILTVGEIAFARPCSSYEHDKAEYFAKIAGNKIISEYGGGNNKRTRLSNCNYNSYLN